MPMSREERIYLAYKQAVTSRKSAKDENPELLAIVDTSEKLRMSALKVLGVVKAREPK